MSIRRKLLVLLLLLWMKKVTIHDKLCVPYKMVLCNRKKFCVTQNVMGD